MKTSILFSFVLCLAACSKPDGPSSTCISDFTTIQECIDSSSIDTTNFCTEEYDPVCGCNKSTYSNQCEAENAGVKSWQKGVCCQ